ncbi:MAG: hypothetical protein ACK5YF_02590 [Rhodobacterales bacterium]
MLGAGELITAFKARIAGIFLVSLSSVCNRTGEVPFSKNELKGAGGLLGSTHSWMMIFPRMFILCLLALCLSSLSVKAENDVPLIEGTVQTTGPQFAWFVEEPSTDRVIRRAADRVKEVVDKENRTILRDIFFTFISHSKLINYNRLDMKYLYFFSQIPESSKIGNLYVPTADCVIIPIDAADDQIIKLVAMDYEPNHPDMQFDCFVYALRESLGLVTQEMPFADSEALFEETLAEMSKENDRLREHRVQKCDFSGLDRSRLD